MTDAERIRLLQKRIAHLEGAIDTYVASANRLGEQRRIAWEGITVNGEPLPTKISIWALSPQGVQNFLNAYRETLEPRATLFNALVEDFLTALVSDPGTTPEMLAKWAPLCAEKITPPEPKRCVSNPVGDFCCWHWRGSLPAVHTEIQADCCWCGGYRTFNYEDAISGHASRSVMPSGSIHGMEYLKC